MKMELYDDINLQIVKTFLLISFQMFKPGKLFIFKSQSRQILHVYIMANISFI